MYWSLNPNSGDTGGILLDDWQSVDPDKEALLTSYQFPLIGTPGAVENNPPPAATTALSATSQPATGPAPTATLSPPPSPQSSPTFNAVSTVGPLAAASGLRVRYHTSNPSDPTSDSKPEFIILNTGQEPLSLERLELAYWFQDEPGRTYMFTCDWAMIGCENISGEFQLAADGANALRVHFKPGLQPLTPGQDSGEIKLRFNRSDWSQFKQADDFSFSPVPNYTETGESSPLSRWQACLGQRAGSS